MSTTTADRRPGSRIDVAVGGDVDPDSGRSLSIGQLQKALRMAQATVSTPATVDRGTDAQGSPLDDMPDQPPTAAQQDQRQPQVRSARPWTLLSRLVGLQNLRSLLSARRNHRCAQSGPAKAVGAWQFPRTERSGSFFVLARRWLVLAVAVMLLVVGAVTVAGRVAAMVNPTPVVVASAPRVADLQFAGAAQTAVLDYLSWDAAAPRAARTTALARWGLTGQMGDGWDGTGQLSIENAVPIAVLRTSDDQRGGDGSGPDHVGNASSGHDFGR